MSIPGVYVYDNSGNLSEIARLLKEHWELPFTEQINRDVFALNRFKRRQGVGREVMWKLHVGGNNSVGSYAEHDSFRPAGRQEYVEARSFFTMNRVIVEVTGLAEAATRGQGGFFEVLGEEMRQGLEDLKNEINRQLLAQTKTNPTDLDSVPIIVDRTATGDVYAGIQRSQSYWGPAILHNGGTARSLTIALMQQMRILLGSTARNANTTAIWAAPKHFYQYGDLLSMFRRYVNPTTMDGGYPALEFESIPVIQVKNLPEGSIYFLDESEWFYYVLENFRTDEKNVDKDARRFVISHYSQLVCKALAKQGRIKDLN